MSEQSSIELSAFIETIQRFREKELEPNILDWEEKEAPLADSVLKTGFEIGLFNFWLPSQLGSAPLLSGLLPKMEVVKELARSSADFAWLVSLQILASLIWQNLDQSQKEKIFDDITQSSSPKLFALALWEPRVKCFGDIISKISSSSLSVKKHLVAFADKASWFIFLVKDEQDELKFIVCERSQLKSIEFKPQPCLGLRQIGRFEISAELASSSDLFFTVEDAKEILNQLVKESSFLSLAVMLGCAQSAYERAKNYAEERYQGGKIIIDHPVIQDMLLNMQAKIKNAELALKKAAEDEIQPESLAGLRRELSNDLIELALDAIQVLGGYGYMLDYGQEKRFRDITSLCLLEFPAQFELV